MTEGERTGPSHEPAKQSDSDFSSALSSTDKRDKHKTTNMLPKELVESLNRGRRLYPKASNDTTIRELHSKLDGADIVITDLSFTDLATLKTNAVSTLIGKMQQILSQQSIKKHARLLPVDCQMEISAARGQRISGLNVNINLNLRITTENRTPNKEKYSLPKSSLQSAIKPNQPQLSHKKIDSLKLISDLKEKFKKKTAPDTTGFSHEKRSKNEDLKKTSQGKLHKTVFKPKELTGTWTSRNLNCLAPNCSKVITISSALPSKQRVREKPLVPRQLPTSAPPVLQSTRPKTEDSDRRQAVLQRLVHPQRQNLRSRKNKACQCQKQIQH